MLKSTIQIDLKNAMKAGDASLRDALRLLLAALTTAEKQEGGELSDAAALQVVSKQVKQTKNAIEEYQGLGAADTVAKLEVELEVYMRYAPSQLSEETVAALVAEAVAVSGAQGPQDMGKVMKLVMPRVQGQADGGMVNRLVKDALSQKD